MIHIARLGKAVGSWSALVAAYPDSEFVKGTRSTLPLLDFWRDQPHALDAMRRMLNLDLESTSLSFEHPTKPAAGRGKASQTDLMIDAKKEAVAVEAKFTEPPDKSVSKWLGDKPTENRSTVLDGWLGLINRRCGTSLAADDVAALSYQLIHRAASACAMERARVHVVYHLFGSLVTVERNITQLRALATLLNTTGALGLAVVHSQARVEPEYSQLLAGLRNNPKPGDTVRQRLLRKPVYDFSTTQVHRVL